MLTPLHKDFDRTRHLRAGDIAFHKRGVRVHVGSGDVPDSMPVCVKQSKTDSSRLGANLVVGWTPRRGDLALIHL